MPPADATRSTMTTEELFEHLRPSDGESAVVANFWATWCRPCAAEMPELVKLHRAFSSRGVRVVAVSIDLPMPVQAETPEDVFGFADKMRFDLPVVVLEGDLGPVVERYGLSGAVPYTIVFDGDGELAARQEGGAAYARFVEMLEAAAPGIGEPLR